MWSYYGSKSKIVKYYPKPKYDVIIEPFAGTAQYSLYADNWKREVKLYDKYDVIVNIWKYLISASEKDILDLPDMCQGDRVDDYGLATPEKYLIGFCINSGSAQPKKTVAKRNSWPSMKKKISNNLYKIRHWTIEKKSYKEIKNQSATWFIDPPYQFGGQYYNSKVSNRHIDYNFLALWCKLRQGQVIVCENSKATWMDFKPLVELHGQKYKTMEMM